MSKKDKFLEDMTKLMQLRRASKGLPPEPRDAISNLVNVKNYMERSRYPTYTILQLIVYFETGFKIFGKDAKILHDSAKILSEALIEYKGKGREEWVNAVKNANVPEQTIFSFGDQRREQPKRRFFSRKSKQESEFTEQ